MASGELPFEYVAADASGRRVKGRVSALDQAGAFERLKRDGLSPIAIKAGSADEAGGARNERSLSDRDIAALLADLGALLRAGADMRTAFAILSSKSNSKPVQAAARALSSDIGGGESLERAFAKQLPTRLDFVAALIAAGEAGGDLAAGFERAADMLSARLKLQDQFVSTLSYPAFVFASTIAALGVIFFFVIPSLAPLVEDSTGPPPAALSTMINVSRIFRSNAMVLAGVGAGLLILGVVAARLGLLRKPIETALLDGPAKRTVGGIVYGGFAVALGGMLAGGAPIGEALRLAVRSVGMSRARDRLDPVAAAVRQGMSLSAALDGVSAFPAAVGRLAAVGEASGAVGSMIEKAGKLEEEAAIRRLEHAGRLLGPALIVVLGGVIGLLMAGLLSGVSQLGQSALN